MYYSQNPTRTYTANAKRAMGLFPLLVISLLTSSVASAQQGTALDAEEPEDARLEPVVVEASAATGEAPVTQRPLGLGIRGETLTSSPGSGGDALRGLQSLPGFVYTDDEIAAPAVRGSRPGDNLYFADFLPVNYLYHLGGAISVFNSDLVESFDIYAAAHGPAYRGTTGGVFDITLREPANDRLRAVIDASFLHAGLLVEGPVTQNQSFYLAGRRSYFDLLIEDQLEEDDGVTLVEFPNYSDYQGKYRWQVNPSLVLSARMSGAQDSLEADIDEDSAEIEDDPVFAGQFFEKLAYDSQALVAEHESSEGRHWRAALMHEDASSRVKAGGAGRIETQSDTWLVKGRVTIPVNESHILRAGGEFERSVVDVNVSLSDPACTEFEPGCRVTGAQRLELYRTIEFDRSHVYVEDSWFVSDKLTLFPGVSLQADSFTDSHYIEPRLSAEYAVNDSLIVSGGIGRYHRMPPFDQILEPFGNPDLAFIASDQIVLGAEKQLKDGWNVRAEGYYKTLENLVASDDRDRYNNAGKGRAYGFETLVRKHLNARWSGWLSLSLSRAERENGETGDRFAFDYDQPVNMSLVANYKASEKWQFGLKYWLHSGAPYTPITGAVEDAENPGFFIPQYGELNSARLADYRRLDIRADRTFQVRRGRKVSAYAEVLNVLSDSNVGGFDYNKEYTEKEAIEQLPTIVSLGLRAGF